MNKKVQFACDVEFVSTFANEEYDRTAQEVAKLTYKDMLELLTMKSQWRREMEKMMVERGEKDCCNKNSNNDPCVVVVSSPSSSTSSSSSSSSSNSSSLTANDNNNSSNTVNNNSPPPAATTSRLFKVQEICI